MTQFSIQSRFLLARVAYVFASSRFRLPSIKIYVFFLQVVIVTQLKISPAKLPMLRSPSTHSEMQGVIEPQSVN